MLLTVPAAWPSLAKSEGSFDHRAPLRQRATQADRRLPWRVSCTAAGLGNEFSAVPAPAFAGSILALAGLSKGRRRVWKRASLAGQLRSVLRRRASLVQARCRGVSSLPSIASAASVPSSQSWQSRRQQLLLGLAVFPAAGACGISGSSAGAAEAVATNVSRLLEQQPALRGFAERFRTLQLKGQTESPRLDQGQQLQRDGEADPAALDAIIDFLESKAAARELGLLGDREQEIWAEVEKSGTAGAEQTLFLKEYYSFWASFNLLFDSALLPLSKTLESRGDAIAVSDISDIMKLDAESGAFAGNVNLLQGLFRRMTKFRRDRQKTGVGGLARNARDSLANSDALSQEASVLIRTYCKDGKFAPGLGALVDLEVVLLRYLRAVVGGELPEYPDVLNQLKIYEEKGTGVTKRKAVLLLYRIQGVFSFLNKFQDEVLTCIENRK